MKAGKITVWMLSLTAWLLLSVSTAWAQDPAAAPAEEGVEVQTVYKKTTIIDFSDVTITGELTKPEGSYLMNKKKSSFNLLIRVRDNFLPEIKSTADNL